jgi:hypothetical protein
MLCVRQHLGEGGVGGAGEEMLKWIFKNFDCETLAVLIGTGGDSW